MAIPTVNMVWQGIGPTVTGEVLAASSVAGDMARTLVGTSTHVMDNSAVASDVNWIDGTATLPFTPSAVVVSRSGGSAALTTGVGQPNSVSGITATKATINWNVTGANASTVITTWIVFK